MNVEGLFDTDARDMPTRGSPAWNQIIFERAYLTPNNGGRFDRVIQRLRAGFSQLVFLPGNCMVAAAQTVKNKFSNKWIECGKHPGSGGDGLQAWESGKDVVQAVVAFLNGEVWRTQHAIFHNLDLLSDWRGAVHGHPQIYEASFALVEATRAGVVLGLADCACPELPPLITRAFQDIVRLDSLDEAEFNAIVPKKLGRKLPGEGPLWQITSRLRWCDPVRAVAIMEDVADGQSSEDILGAIAARSKPEGYQEPKDAFGDNDDAINGFDVARTLRPLEEEIIQAYKEWIDFKADSKEGYKAALRCLRNGLILHGPPGTGKTTLARWTARQINLPVKVVSGSDLRRSGWGDAERCVHELFADARRAAPCVLVFDDGDDLFPSRSNERKGSSTAGAELAVVNAMLQALDGIGGPLSGVLVILTTNRFEDLDKAIQDRLGLHVPVPYPLNKTQVKTIVQSIAKRYQLDLSAEEAQLVSFFMEAVDPNTHVGNIATEEDRFKRSSNLFSPREIASAMLQLRKGLAAPYVVTTKDVERMRLNVKNQPRKTVPQ